MEVNTSENKEEVVAVEPEATPDVIKPQDLPDQTRTLMYLQQAIPQIRSKITQYKGSSKQLKRVLVSIAEHGMVDNPISLSYQEERELFDLLATIFDAKMLLFHHAATENELNLSKGESNG